MSRSHGVGFGGVLAVFLLLHAVSVPSSFAQAAAIDPVFLSDHCVSCHSDRLRAGDVSLETIDLGDVGANRELWERVVRQLRTGAMPPAGAPQPDPSVTAGFVSALEADLDRTAVPAPGRPPAHRLNRAEYANAIRDLLALDVDPAALFPPDPSLGGFDNIGGVLSVSPLLVERYFEAARRIARLAVGDPTVGPAFAARTVDIEKDLFQDQRMSEDLPFGSRGGIALRHYFPLDGEYVIRVGLRRNIFGYVRGLAYSHQLEIRLDGTTVERLDVGGRDLGQPAPASFGGVIAGDPAWEAYALAADADLVVRVSVTAGEHVVGVAFVDRLVEEEGVLLPPLTGLGLGFSEWRSSPTGAPGPAVDSVSVTGPYHPRAVGATPSRARIFSCRPAAAADEDPCAKEILAALARRAYRGAVTDGDLDVLFDFFRSGRSGGTFEDGIQQALERLLVDPKFLFRIETDPLGVSPGTPYAVADLALASRISFFLWSGPPDDELLDLAEHGHLRDEAVLDAQVRRMLDDDRAAALVENFASQWLGLRRLRDVKPDPERFPEFDENLREAFRRETQLLVANQLREDRSIIELVTADYSYINERLARHYEVPDVYGSRFRRVRLDGDRRGGLLGLGSILTVTSYPTRTSPVQRGRWLLENLFGAPPPPPPPGTPTDLPAPGVNGQTVTIRERMERHRRNPPCAGCHARMDPLGFALEQFDAIGRWREQDETAALIDASGSFPDGVRFEGPAGVRALVRDRPDEFARTLTEKLLTYALGRPVTYADMPAVRTIVRRAGEAGYRWSSLIREVVRSVPFQMRVASP